MKTSSTMIAICIAIGAVGCEADVDESPEGQVSELTIKHERPPELDSLTSELDIETHPSVTERTVVKSSEFGWELMDVAEGVRIQKIDVNSLAARAGIQEGDIIRRVDRQETLSSQRLATVLATTDADVDEVEIVVLRHGEELSYLLPLANVTVVEGHSTERSEPALAQILWQMQQQMDRQERKLNQLLVEVEALREAAGVPRTRVTTQETELETNVVTPLSPPVTPPAGGTNNPTVP